LALRNDNVRDRFHAVPTENNAFVDRPGIMKEIQAAFEGHSTSGCKVVALTGLGGMGKTQLLLRYCYLYQGEYKYVFWLDIDGRTTAVDSFRKLAINLGVDEKSMKQLDKEGKIIQWVCSWLEKRTGWLLLLDNADGEMARDIFKCLPRFGGSIILSTREHI